MIIIRETMVPLKINTILLVLFAIIFVPHKVLSPYGAPFKTRAPTEDEIALGNYDTKLNIL